MRVCTNTRCNTFGRIVYSVATRCPLCRWDLKPVSDINANPIPLQQSSVANGGPSEAMARPSGGAERDQRSSAARFSH